MDSSHTSIYLAKSYTPSTAYELPPGGKLLGFISPLFVTRTNLIQFSPTHWPFHSDSRSRLLASVRSGIQYPVSNSFVSLTCCCLILISLALGSLPCFRPACRSASSSVLRDTYSDTNSSIVLSGSGDKTSGRLSFMNCIRFTIRVLTYVCCP